MVCELDIPGVWTLPAKRVRVCASVHHEYYCGMTCTAFEIRFIAPLVHTL